MANLCVIQECPVYNDIGPYIAIITLDAKATINSIYRGDAAAKILNHYGKHTQRQLADATPAERLAWGILGTPDPPGYSTHELFSDGVAYPEVPRGKALQWWQQGFDVDDQDTAPVIAQALRHGWEVFRPYSSGVEYHHLCFRVQPHLTPRTALRIQRLRRTLPRS